uniref:Adenylate kinase 8 isoform X1 n=2 Tax=Pogona vitticeps TaxID=103695 RepID=A0ABM5F6J2_9SAUR
MDATKRPLSVPARMGRYAEEQRLFHTMKGILEALLIHKPEEPIDFLIKELKLDNFDVPKILILGPPASGKTTIAMWLSKQLAVPRISRETLVASDWSSLAVQAQEYHHRQEKVPDELWVRMIEERMQLEDCLCNGWILDGLSETRELARTFQAMGIIPKHIVVLYAPDVVLIERNLGKRVDAVTGEVYHTTFDWPTDETVLRNLKKPDGLSEAETSRRLLEYHQNYYGILQSFGEQMKLINADQPCPDVFLQVLSHVQVPPRIAAPFSPRILLCGPPGSGKSLQAALLAQKYGIINVCCGQILKEAVADDTKLGELIKPYFDNGWPVADNIVVKLLSERLNTLDAHIHGWVLHGFPRDEDQAKLMAHADIHPNRVFFLSLSADTILERLSYRTVDPITGERYHTLYKPAPTEEVNDRLLVHPKNTEDAVKLKVDAYFRLAGDLENFFEDAVVINADQDPQTIFEYIESYIVNPLSKTQKDL